MIDVNRSNLETRNIALVLAAHGASDDPRCAAPVERHAQAIRSLGLFADVVTVYWKQPPFFRDWRELTSAGRVVAVPVMTADGYYAQRVLPRELGFDRAGDQELTVTPAIGVDPAIDELILAQAQSAADEAAIALKDAHLLIVGHGTRRDPIRSGASTLDAVKRLSNRGFAASIHAAFLEQDPVVPEAVAKIEGTGPIIIVPNLIANGGHAVHDIPHSLGLAPGGRRGDVNGGTVIFGDAVGEHPGIAQLILNAARRAMGSKATEQDSTLLAGVG